MSSASCSPGRTPPRCARVPCCSPSAFQPSRSARAGGTPRSPTWWRAYVSLACLPNAGCSSRKRATRFGSITAMRGPDTTLEVSVWRGGADGGFQRYSVPRQGAQTVLDIVTWIQRRLDPSLAYRFACRVGMCGSCAMTVNGVARWTCRTHVEAVAQDDRLEIAPLANLPIVRDLVTDMREFFDKWNRAKGQFKPTATRHEDFARVRPDSPARQAVDAAIECIGCAVCYSACDVVAWNPDYLGPAALNRAWALQRDA